MLAKKSVNNKRPFKIILENCIRPGNWRSSMANGKSKANLNRHLALSSPVLDKENA
jgi:hypothetical protein